MEEEMKEEEAVEDAKTEFVAQIRIPWAWVMASLPAWAEKYVEDRWDGLRVKAHFLGKQLQSVTLGKREILPELDYSEMEYLGQLHQLSPADRKKAGVLRSVRLRLLAEGLYEGTQPHGSEINDLPGQPGVVGMEATIDWVVSPNDSSNLLGLVQQIYTKMADGVPVKTALRDFLFSLANTEGEWLGDYLNLRISVEDVKEESLSEKEKILEQVRELLDQLEEM